MPRMLLLAVAFLMIAATGYGTSGAQQHTLALPGSRIEALKKLLRRAP